MPVMRTSSVIRKTVLLSDIIKDISDGMIPMLFNI